MAVNVFDRGSRVTAGDLIAERDRSILFTFSALV